MATAGGLLSGLALVPLVLSAPALAAPATDAPALGPEAHRSFAFQLTPPLPAPPATALAPTDDWERGERRALFWTGALLIPISAGVAVGGIALRNQDGKNACTPPAGKICERVYDTNAHGWATIGLAVGGALAGLTMMWLYRDRDTSVALSPTGVSGRF
jgi:hypothetical protein